MLPVLATLLAYGAEPKNKFPSPLQGVLVDARQATAEQLERLASEGYSAVALSLTAHEGERAAEETRAAQAIAASGLDLLYWIEIGRCPELADAHPRWMASLQGHDEWRRLFPDTPQPGADEVVKVYPWTPILYREVQEAQLTRVRRLLAGRPQPCAVFLNDLQGAPSACGCGNMLCRWTSDYGPVLTATKLDDDAAARFTAAVKANVPGVHVIPVWTTECEEHDGARDGACAGVGCFRGTCWRVYSKQLGPLAQEAPLLGVLLTYRELERDLPVYRQPAGWTGTAIESFQKMPPQRGGQALPAERLIAVLQGWDVTPDELRAQIDYARQAGAAGYLVARTKIDQSWSPRLIRTGR